MNLFGSASNQINDLQAQIVINFLILAFAGLIIFIVLHALFDLVAYTAYRFKYRVAFVPRSWLALVIASLWTALSPSQSSAISIASADGSVQVRSQSESPKFGSFSSINSLLTCSMIVAQLLLELGKIRGRQMCKLEINSRLSHPSAPAILTELGLRAVANSQADQSGSNYLTANSELPIFVPLGITNSLLTFVDLGKNTIVNIVGDDQDASEAVFKALMLSALCACSGKSQIIYYSRANHGDACFTGLNVASSVDEVLWHAGYLEIQSILFCYETLNNIEIEQLREKEISVVCLHSTPRVTNTLRVEESKWYLNPGDTIISPFGLSKSQISALSELFTDVVRCAEPVASSSTVAFNNFSNYKVLVRILGPVDVQLADGTVIKFEKTKTIELLAWLTNHRSRPTRSAARTALWEFNVADATFTNVVSDIRRTLNQMHLLEPLEEWIPRTFSDQLPFHYSIISDGELLEDCISRAQKLSPAEAVVELHRGLELVRDLPFAGTGYLWPDAEGITSQLVMTVITAACMAAELDLSSGNVEGVFWATAQGLKVLGAHEELFALRMRAHSSRGDLAGVRFEFESYQRATKSESFQISEPSSKLVALYRQLTLQNPVVLAR